MSCDKTEMKEARLSVGNFTVGKSCQSDVEHEYSKVPAVAYGVGHSQRTRATRDVPVKRALGRRGNKPHEEILLLERA